MMFFVAFFLLLKNIAFLNEIITYQKNEYDGDWGEKPKPPTGGGEGGGGGAGTSLPQSCKKIK